MHANILGTSTSSMARSSSKCLVLTAVALLDASVSATVLQPTPPMGMQFPRQWFQK